MSTSASTKRWTRPRLIEVDETEGPPSQGPILDSEDSLLSVEEVAAFLRVSPETVKYLRSQRRFAPAIKIGRRVMWLRRDVIEWRNGQRESA